jgi:hypothetical protein
MPVKSSSNGKRRGSSKSLERLGKIPRWNFDKLEQLPNVGPALAGDLRLIGISLPTELIGRDPFALYNTLCRTTGERHDPCVIDVFISVVWFMEGGKARPWWAFTAQRKRELATRGAS